MRQIPFNKVPYLPESEYINIIEDVVPNDFLVGGKIVQEFEEKWAERCGTYYCVGVGNGFDAIRLILESQNVKGKKILVSAMTALPTYQAIMAAGAIPVSVDIDKRTWQFDVEDAIEKVDRKTVGMVVVHIYGMTADMDAISKFAKDKKLFIVEDCAQAHGAQYSIDGEGKPVGSMGIAAAWSFYPTKNLGCLGDGGAVTTNSGLIHNLVRMRANYGVGDVKTLHGGYNSRLDTIQAAVLLRHLRDFDGRNTARQKIVHEYDAQLFPYGYRSQDNYVWSYNVYHQYVIKLKEGYDRDNVRGLLDSVGVATAVHYKEIPHKTLKLKGKFPHIAYDLSKRCLSLPIYPELSYDDLYYVVDSLLSLDGIPPRRFGKGLLWQRK